MSFDELHPAIQHHIVNSLGWKSLRQIQEDSINPIVRGDDLLVIGPTAGGKTEAAALPLLSRMLSEEWSGLGAVFVSPLRALANDLEVRLGELFGLVGRNVAAWHGDVSQGRRKEILREPPDLMVTTPESLEVMLVSQSVEHRRLFSELRAIVVDEVHSFGSDDRGWHLLAVTARIENLTGGRRLQRIGLSATVGNPEGLLEWLSMPASQASAPVKSVVRSAVGARRDAEIRVDHVESIVNASKVIAGLHHGEKRLVFCDSRARVEKVAALLREAGVEVFVSHSSLSKEERRQAELGFAEHSNCVMVATSTLELGIDIGDLDRVIQIDAPTTVASFLQRMGRTGRRPGTKPNILFLTTDSDCFLRSLGLVTLWGDQFVEKVEPPPAPRHVVAQQLLGLCLQEGSVGVSTWFAWIEAAGLAERSEASRIQQFMVEQGMLVADQGMLSVGVEAEATFGRRHFMELLSVFTTPPLIEVRFGNEPVGSVHESSFYVRENQQPVILLAGRSWILEELDWKRRRAYVTPAPELGDSKWKGSGLPISFDLSQAIKKVLAGDKPPAILSSRGKSLLADLREEFEWLSRDSTTVVGENGRKRWWTFAGTLGNLELRWRIGDLAASSSGVDELSVPLSPETSIASLRLKLKEPRAGRQPVDPDAVSELKFNECLPQTIAEDTLAQRAQDVRSVQKITSTPISGRAI